MREIITLAFGQAGVQISSAIWELITAEHNINSEGVITDDKINDEIFHDPFFTHGNHDNYIPRTVIADLEPTVMDEVRQGYYRGLFHPDTLINGQEDAANNFARGFFTIGRLITDAIGDQIRKQYENSDNVQAFYIFRSCGGGTGSGLTSAMFDYLIDYTKTQRIEIPIYPSPTVTTCVVEPYNCLLSQHFCMDDIEMSIIVDNEAMYDLVQSCLNPSNSSFSIINRLLAQAINSLTCPLRYPNLITNDLVTQQTNLIPYPRIHFPLLNYAPIDNYNKMHHTKNSVLDITRAVFDKDNQLVKCDTQNAVYMSCSMTYRGHNPPPEIAEALRKIKSKKGIRFVDWCPTGFKIGLCPFLPVTVPGSLIAPTNRNVSMLTNSSCIGQAIQRICHKFHILYSKRSFVHWFVGEGMEENEFQEGLYNISTLIKDYEEVTKTQAEIEGNVEEEFDQNQIVSSGSKQVPSTNIENEENEVEQQENVEQEEGDAEGEGEGEGEGGGEAQPQEEVEAASEPETGGEEEAPAEAENVEE